MFLHVTVDRLRGRPIVSCLLICFSIQYCDITSLISLRITQAFYLLLDFAENQTPFWDFKIRHGVWITEVSDNADSDNQGPTVHLKVLK